MAETAHLARGYLYPTHLYARCTNYRKCPVCGMCENYSKTLADCIYCESRKSPVMFCKCPASRKAAAYKIQRIIKGRLLDPNNKGSVTRTDVSQVEKWDSIAANLKVGQE